MPLFEVRYHGVPKMATDDPSCIYDAETLRSMQKFGYTFRYKGKSCPPSAIPSPSKEKTRNEQIKK